ncbi:MAG TPA: hypothetical protein VFZ65_05730 [Planctomycetota bacterium]|nr:hypothetical protein [Planctomycetota bacterium]
MGTRRTTRRLLRLLPALTAAALLWGPTRLPGQDDLRDVVTLTNGQEVRGRVYERFEADEVTLLQGNQRLRVPRSRVATIDSLRERMREFFARHDRLPDNAHHRWYLADWAQRHGLVALAQLQAMDVVLHDPEHEPARALLGHRRRGKEWLWPRRDQWFTLADHEAYCADWGHPLLLESEHFVVQTNGGLRRAIDTAFDLERLYVWWFDTFGEALRLREVVSPKMPVQVWRSRREFPPWSSIVQPYFRPRVENLEQSTSYTFFEDAAAGRATRLFEVATQHLLYRTLAADPPFPTAKERLCAWAEVGLGQFVEHCFAGEPGRARAGPWRLPAHEGALVLGEHRYGLDILTHRQARQYFVTVADDTPFDQASAHLFVAYLLDPDRQPKLREGFLEFLFEALRTGKGESSSALDKLIGRKVETLEQPWRAWIEAALQKNQPRSGG